MGLWSKKSIYTLAKSVESQEELEIPKQSSTLESFKLRRTLGPLNLIALGIGVIIGAGLFSITGIAAAEHAGPAIILSFLVAAFGCCLAGLCYSELASMIPVAGSAYTYAYVTLGELLAWIIGWDLVLEYALGATTVSISWSAYVVSLLKDFNIHLPIDWIASPWHPTLLADGTLNYGMFNFPAFFIICLATLILILGIKESAVVNALIVVIKVSVVILFIALGVNYIQWENYTPFIPANTGEYGSFGISGIMRAAGIVFFAYIGFDSISTAAQETVNPQRNMPIGILGSLVICTILYVLFSFVMVGMVNYKALNVAAPVALAVDQTPYFWLNWLVKLAILAGFTSVILVMLLGQSRIFYAMSRDGLLPPIFSDLHTKFKTPWKSNLVIMLFVGLLGAFAPLSLVGNLVSIGTLFAFVVVSAAVLVLRYTYPEYPRSFKTPFVPWVPLLGILVCSAMMASLSYDTWIRLAVWLALGMLIYFSYGKRHSLESERSGSKKGKK
jgi:APA family basic amino acid/polyamine antiporter